MPRISVIIPTYNRAELAAAAIESVLNQTFRDFELIVVDDGSTDNTEEIIRSISDPRLKYIRQANRGVSAARNSALEACTGEVVAFLDSDDLWLPEKLERQIAKLDRHPEAGLVYSLYYSSASEEEPRKLRGTCEPQLNLRQLLFGTAFHWSTVIIVRSWLGQIGGFDEQFPVGEEWELTLRLSLAGCYMICEPQPLTIVRQQPKSLAKSAHYHESALMAVLDKTFSSPNMPSDLIKIQDIARATQLLRIAASAYATLEFETGREILQQAFAACPSLTSKDIDFLVEKLVYRIRGLSVDDPEKVLHQVAQYLPGNRTFLRRLRPKLWGKFYEIAAFDSYKLGQRGKCVGYAIRAVSMTPSCLRNRGLLSVFFASLVGNQTNNEFQNLAGVQRES